MKYCKTCRFFGNSVCHAFPPTVIPTGGTWTSGSSFRPNVNSHDRACRYHEDEFDSELQTAMKETK